MQDEFCSNINAVSKPVAGKVHLGQADTYLDKLKGNSGNSQRICLDLRKVNETMSVDPKICLPSYKSLARKFENCFCSAFDLCSMYFAIPIDYASMHKQTFGLQGRFTKCAEDFPLSDISEFLLCYLDDLLIYRIEHAEKVHLLLIRFLLFCTIKLGFKSEVQLFPTSFKFPGHLFMTVHLFHRIKHRLFNS